MFAAIKAWFKRVFGGSPQINPPATGGVEKPGEVIPVHPPKEPFPQLPEADYKGEIRLGVIVGHTASDQGAEMCAPYKHSEYIYNNMVAEKMLQFARKMFPQIDVKIIHRDGIGIHGAYRVAEKLGCDAVIELHFNFYNGEASGSETLCTADYSDVQFAQVIHKAVCQIFGRQGESRGVKAISRSARGGDNVHSFPVGVNCLVEPFFGDNEIEASLGMARCDEYAEALVRAVALWGRQVDLLR